VLRRRWAAIGTALLVATAVVAVALLQPRRFTSSASFVPQAPAQAVSGLSSVASQFGLNVGEGANTDSPAFYADLLLSQTVLEAVADGSYTVVVDGERRTAPLADLLGIEAENAALRRHEVIRYLRRHLGSSVTPKTGAVVVSATMPWAALSQQVADRMLALVGEFNRERRQSRAVAERRFTEQQLAEARAALRAAERQLEAFLVRNRQFDRSPTLEFERERLAREVAVRSQRYMTVSDAYERARIEEIRDTPVLTVIDAPRVPVLPDRRYLALKGLVGLTVGLVLGVALALVRHLLAATQRSRADEYAEFEALRRDTLADLRRPWRPLMRRRAVGSGA
jgi:uncharacterized protein involved in exopolysaccharide biosynthesis